MESRGFEEGDWEKMLPCKPNTAKWRMNRANVWRAMNKKIDRLSTLEDIGYDAEFCGKNETNVLSRSVRWWSWLHGRHFTSRIYLGRDIVTILIGLIPIPSKGFHYSFKAWQSPQWFWVTEFPTLQKTCWISFTKTFLCYKKMLLNLNVICKLNP
jgi:hypothetical protein